MLDFIPLSAKKKKKKQKKTFFRMLNLTLHKNKNYIVPCEDQIIYV